jgi:hypothetical protein
MLGAWFPVIARTTLEWRDGGMMGQIRFFGALFSPVFQHSNTPAFQCPNIPLPSVYVFPDHEQR